MSEAPERLIPWPELRPLIGNVSRMTWYRAVKRGDAPKPVQVSPGRIAWAQSAIAAYQARNSVQEAA